RPPQRWELPHEALRPVGAAHPGRLVGHPGPGLGRPSRPRARPGRHPRRALAIDPDRRRKGATAMTTTPLTHTASPTALEGPPDAAYAPRRWPLLLIA